MANSIAWDWNTFREWVNLTSSKAHRLLYYKFRLQAPIFFTLKQPNIIQKTGNVIMSTPIQDFFFIQLYNKLIVRS